MRNNSDLVEPAVHKLHWRVAGVVVFLLAILGSFSLAAMLVDRQPPTQFLERKALNDKVPQGGVLSVHFKVRRDRLCRAEVFRWVIDSEHTKHAISSFTTALDSTLGEISDVREISLPPAVAVGPAVYYVEAEYYCNTLQWIFDWPIVVRSPDAHFEVVPGENITLTPAEIEFIRFAHRYQRLLRPWDDRTVRRVRSP
ncbi:hypothetical protein [Rhizobium phage RHph_X3_2]|nr:hypothetical protein [Rhizobium phage RHph_X3_2]